MSADDILNANDSSPCGPGCLCESGVPIPGLDFRTEEVNFNEVVLAPDILRENNSNTHGPSDSALYSQEANLDFGSDLDLTSGVEEAPQVKEAADILNANDTSQCGPSC